MTNTEKYSTYATLLEIDFAANEFIAECLDSADEMLAISEKDNPDNLDLDGHHHFLDQLFNTLLIAGEEEMV